MQTVGGSLHLSASDLVGHINCRYLTHLDLRAVGGRLAKPAPHAPGLDVLIERGLRHEQGYLAHLAESGLAVTSIEGVGVDARSVGETRAAMTAGAPAIAQAALQAGQWGGRAAALWRVEEPGGRGSWSYEVVDTKLAKETKGGTILQLSLYADLLAGVQARSPEWAYVVTPETGSLRQPYRIAEYAAYYRRARPGLAGGVASAPPPDAVGAPPPRPKPHRPT